MQSRKEKGEKSIQKLEKRKREKRKIYPVKKAI